MDADSILNSPSSTGGVRCSACRESGSECPTCATCAFTFETKDRACASLLDLIERLPLADYPHLHSIFEVLHCVADYRLPLSGAPTSLSRYHRVLQREFDTQRRVESPIEQRMWEILDEAGLASQFVMQEPIQVEYTSRTGRLTRGTTRPDLRHATLRVAIYCDGGDHSKPQVRETDALVIEALQQQGYFLVRPSGRQILNEPARCLARVQRAIESARVRPAA
jgi:very-short-patch-repair endonuclease